jgi:hypothetical protein
MKAELKQKWVKALRSGLYEQGKGRLKSLDDRFCCLGVLADVYGCSWQPNPNSKYVYDLAVEGVVDAVQGYTSVLPQPFLDVVGLDQDHCGTLVNMNDAVGMSFYGIAQWIDANVAETP